nr:unnamed protein product [Callosobruchus analis]
MNLIFIAATPPPKLGMIAAVLVFFLRCRKVKG